ncbi:unnamed protein product, partial [Urochloa humidicola]
PPPAAGEARGCGGDRRWCAAALLTAWLAGALPPSRSLLATSPAHPAAHVAVVLMPSPLAGGRVVLGVGGVMALCRGGRRTWVSTGLGAYEPLPALRRPPVRQPRGAQRMKCPDDLAGFDDSDIALHAEADHLRLLAERRHPSPLSLILPAAGKRQGWRLGGADKEEEMWQGRKESSPCLTSPSTTLPATALRRPPSSRPG